VATWVVKRCLWALMLALAVATSIFAIVNLLPGDPITLILGEASMHGYYDTAQLLRQQLGLDLPVYQRYVRWLASLLQGDMGTSLYTNTPVAVEIARKLPRTVELIVPAVILGILIGIPLGVVTAIRRDTLVDRTLSVFGVTLHSLPVFVTGTLAVLLFSITLQWLPPSGYVPWHESLSEFAKRALMPTLALACTVIPTTMRMTRSTLLEVLGMDYVRTARAKGLQEQVVLYKHALRNALIPVIAVVGLQMGYMFGGTVITELIFAWPGLSTYLFFGIFKRDYPVVQGVVLVTSLILIAINLLTDLLFGLLDPRIRYE
jgi:peptide/nickel transport system permease protein